MENTNPPDGTVSSKHCWCHKQKQAEQILYSGWLLLDLPKGKNTERMLWKYIHKCFIHRVFFCTESMHACFLKCISWVSESPAVDPCTEVRFRKGWDTPDWHQRTTGNKAQLSCLTSPVSEQKSWTWIFHKDYGQQASSTYVLHQEVAAVCMSFKSWNQKTQD